MRKITVIEHVSIDGVIQAPGGPDEDRDGGFPHGGWTVPHADPVAGEFIVGAHAGSFDLLLGRRTYDIWSAYWPRSERSPFAGAFNAATKYVATHRPESLGWGPAEGLGADVAGSVRRLTASDGADLIVWGSSTLVPVLIREGLADEVALIVYPVLLGAGKRLFSEGAEARGLTLIDSRVGQAGVLVNRYGPAGALRTGTFIEPAG